MTHSACVTALGSRHVVPDRLPCEADRGMFYPVACLQLSLYPEPFSLSVGTMVKNVASHFIQHWVSPSALLKPTGKKSCHFATGINWDLQYFDIKLVTGKPKG